jgi:hypothetical protein
MILHAAGLRLVSFSPAMAGREVGPISTTSAFGGFCCSVK